MKPVLVYTAKVCSYCVRTKALLTQKGILFEEIDISRDWDLREAMIEKAGGRKTVPQIFIGDYHVGGCEELYALEAQGQLDTLFS
ncbi:Glutaredoxin-3 [Candidatus Bealeia paramacronuclearis]|uniref:Glutaredoxin n=1 Tax=Candidatus Bealeia paramacronuclearis TaxID=1921001 RepID=A0ABZ2C533_9PROT|nr:Glutaredoxin-3 [Candidatus Bealeia paramacronuclearis]